jgi:hypothetical protein
LPIEKKKYLMNNEIGFNWQSRTLIRKPKKAEKLQNSGTAETLREEIESAKDHSAQINADSVPRTHALLPDRTPRVLSVVHPHASRATTVAA